ncbi:hypothetical protein HUJ05_003569 [Dendroctonus ponderosae]|nr:hypothetical protein HUJ05_003569 [Dendroctonus ponderosae]
MVRIHYFKKPKRLCGWLKRKYLRARVKEKDGTTKLIYNPESESKSCSRHERDTCINNLKLNLNVSSTSADFIRWRSSKSKPQARIRTSLKDKYSRGSLDNVSRIPWEECNLDEESTLRRTRSLAISRENLFYSLDYIETTENHRRRAQLIPRAKLIEKSFIKDSRYEPFQVENIRAPAKKILNKPEEIPPDYSPLPRNISLNHFPHEEHIYDIPPEYATQNNSPFSENIRSRISGKEVQSVASQSFFRKPFEDLTGLSLPNYYPDSEVTDNVSLTDVQSTYSQDKIRYTSLSNFPWGVSEQPDSISYDENIVLTKKPENLYVKPRTIRGPIPYHNFAYEKLPQFNSEKLKEPEKSSESTPEQQSSLEFETNTNCDEIKLNNEHISKEKSNSELVDCDKPEPHCKVIGNVSKTDANQVVFRADLEKTLQPEVITKIEKTDTDSASRTIEVTSSYASSSASPIKTLIELCHIESSAQSEEFKSIIELKSHNEEVKNHSHNYLKEFLETQKGSKKPLQSFIVKKFSNLTRRQSKSNLVSNQFYSLPDISASKNLQKCEKIDRKLRKCERLVKAPVSENRFIVNIGNHFDITAKSNIPVDFQVKIAKVPKRSKKQSISNKGTEKEFAEAVKSINNTLLNNGFRIDFNNNKTQQVKLELKSSKLEKKKDMMDPEIKEKVDNMRTYWTNIMGTNDLEKCDEEKELESSPCKILEIQTKVNNVKKKFQPDKEIIEDKEISPNKVQLAKQLFEPKPVQEKVDKISPAIKETCNYFEKPSVIRESSCYESLSPNSVELVTVKHKNATAIERPRKSPKDCAKPKKPLSKANSINVPEFDHVRYKVIKPELFNKKIIANCENQAQFDGLMQYLQDYSFQELLLDNNIVIIEPIRTKVPHQNQKNVSKNDKKNNNSANQVPDDNKDVDFDDVKQGIRKHFFYHPIRVNKEVNDDELPNPDVVRQARQFFEKEVLKIQSDRENGFEKEQYKNIGADPDKDKCSTSSSAASTLSDAEEEPMYDSLDQEYCCTTEYVSEDILEKIREYGTTVTYYGGRVVNQHNGQPILTKVIMEEIKNNEKRCMECNSCRRRSVDKTLNEVNKEYQGIKFKLIKSNSCNSRLELVGAAKNKELTKDSSNKLDVNKRSDKENNYLKEFNNNNDSNDMKCLNIDKNAINENIKLASQPRIIGEERKIPDKIYGKLSEINNEQPNTEFQLNGKGDEKIKNYDYHEKIKSNRRPCDMEFEPYEVASK